MKKLFMLLSLMIIVAGCNSAPNWSAKIEQAPYFKDGEASQLVVSVKEEGNEVKGLEVEAVLEMTKMDHDDLKVQLKEQDAGIYIGEIVLPMAGEWEAIVTMKDGEQETETVLTFEAEKANGVALVNDQEITKEDLDFYRVINEIQIAMYEEADRKQYSGAELDEALRYWEQQREVLDNRNTLLSQIIRLQAAKLLGEEKGYTAEPKEIEAAVKEVKQQYAKSEVAQQLIQEYGEEKFWNKEHQQYEAILITRKVQEDVVNKVKEENPQSQQNEVNMLAQKEYEELLVSQVGTLNIKVF
ncbi:FixH family protein [Bacillus tianshenii]|nr:FixH family protein [Bacillus tianshenii]